jgi:hypothetical protein
VVLQQLVLVGFTLASAIAFALAAASAAIFLLIDFRTMLWFSILQPSFVHQPCFCICYCFFSGCFQLILSEYPHLI